MATQEWRAVIEVSKERIRHGKRKKYFMGEKILFIKAPTIVDAMNKAIAFCKRGRRGRCLKIESA